MPYSSSKIRVGNGIDVHPLVSGRKLILGGVDINHHSGCDGHSDGDVLVHSIMDSLLGAMGKGDIGDYFPSSDDQYKNADSIELLNKILLIMKNEHWSIINIDATIVLQSPPIKSFIKAIKSNLSLDCNLSIKATTTDKLGFIGKNQGVAVITTCLLEKI
tara:strand:+ start:15530 stop:16009 length:480 start_codon:yes stop_codon:yes gene_type:complete